MKLVANLPWDAEEEEEEESVSDGKEEDQRKGLWAERSDGKEDDPRKGLWAERSGIRLDFQSPKGELSPQRQKSHSGILSTGLSNLKPVLLTSASDSQSDPSNQTMQRLLDILRLGKSVNILDVQVKQQEKRIPDPPQTSTFAKVPPTSIKTYITQLLLKPKLRDDLVRKMESIGVEGLSRADVDDALRQILNRSSKTDKGLRPRSASATRRFASKRAGYGFQRQQTVGKGRDLFVVGDQIYSGHSQLDPEELTVRHDPTAQNRASTRTGSTSNRGSRLRGADRTSAELRSEGRSKRRQSRRRSSGGRKSASSSEKETGEDQKKRKFSAASVKNVGVLEKDDGWRMMTGSGGEENPGDRNLQLRLSKGQFDIDKALISAGRHKDMAINDLYKGTVPTDLTQEVTSDSPERPPRAPALKDPSAGDLLGPAARSHAPGLGAASSASSAQGRGPDVGLKFAGSSTPASAPQGSGLGKGLAMQQGRREGEGTMLLGRREGEGTMQQGRREGEGKGWREKRPSSSPVKKVGMDPEGGKQLRRTARSRKSNLQGSSTPADGFPVVNEVSSVRGSVPGSKKKKGGAHKAKDRARTGRRRGKSLQSSSTKPRLSGSTKEEETKSDGKPSEMFAPSRVSSTDHGGTGSSKDHATGSPKDHGTGSSKNHGTGSSKDHGTGSPTGHGTRSSAASGTGSANDHAIIRSRRPMKERKYIYFPPSVSSSVTSSPDVVVNHVESEAPSGQDGGSHEKLTESNVENQTVEAVQVVPTETEPTAESTLLITTPSEATVFSSPTPAEQKPSVVPPPPKRIFLAHGDDYGLPTKGFELTRAFVFSYFQRMPPHYVDFKINPPILPAKKKKTK